MSAAPAQPPRADRTPWGLMARLSAMMYLQSVPLGSWGVTIGTFIAANTGDQGSGAYSAGFIGYSTAAGAIGGLISPVVFGLLSDRWFSAQKLLALLHLGCALSVAAMYVAESQTGLFIGLLCYFHCYVPSVALSNKIGLKHLADPDAEFPLVRVFGTLGWISAGLIVGLAWPWLWGHSIEATRIPFAIGVVADLVIAAYALTLPHTPPERDQDTSASLAEAFWGGVKLLSDRSIAVFLVVAFLACVPSMAYNNFANPFLNLSGYQSAAALMTVGQVSEILVLWVMPLLIFRLGLRWLFVLGLLAWTLRYGFLALGGEWAMSPPVYAAILLHGPCFAFIYVGGPMYIDHLVQAKDRGFAQGLYAVAATGLGHLAGAGLVGWSQEQFLTPSDAPTPPYDWTSFWLLPGVLSLLTTILFLAFFRTGETQTSPGQS